jgi:hypothetical protein
MAMKGIYESNHHFKEENKNNESTYSLQTNTNSATSHRIGAHCARITDGRTRERRN